MMARYVLKRIGLALLAIIGVSIFVFVAARLSGDVTYLLAGDAATPAELAAIRHQLGLDQPLWIQYALFLNALVHGNFGDSIHYHTPVVDLIGQRVGASLELTVVAFLTALVFGIALGAAAALSRGSAFDIAIRGFVAVAQSMPNFWFGLIAIIVFAVNLGWFPTSGAAVPQAVVLPALTLALFPLAAIARVTRSAMLETIGAEYTRYLRAKGLPYGIIVAKHVLRNALIPITALAGVQLGFLLGGTVIVESVFAWPGLGSLMVDAMQSRDYPLIQAGTLLVSIVLVFLNLAVDMLFGVIDPRIRYA
jgi:peptide/nickel transport system permease protein